MATTFVYGAGSQLVAVIVDGPASGAGASTGGFFSFFAFWMGGAGA